MWPWSGNPGVGRLKDWEGYFPGGPVVKNPHCCAGRWLPRAGELGSQALWTIATEPIHSRALWDGVQQAVCAMTWEFKTATENTITPNNCMKSNLIRVITDWRQRQRAWQTKKEFPYHMIGDSCVPPPSPKINSRKVHNECVSQELAKEQNKGIFSKSYFPIKFSFKIRHLRPVNELGNSNERTFQRRQKWKRQAKFLNTCWRSQAPSIISTLVLTPRTQS